MESGIYETIDHYAMDKGFNNIASTGKEVQQPSSKPAGEHLTMPGPSSDSGYYNIESTAEPEYLEPRNLEQIPPLSEPGYINILESTADPEYLEPRNLEQIPPLPFPKMKKSPKQKCISNKCIIILVVIGFVICLAIGSGVGYDFMNMSTAYKGWLSI